MDKPWLDVIWSEDLLLTTVEEEEEKSAELLGQATVLIVDWCDVVNASQFQT